VEEASQVVIEGFGGDGSHEVVDESKQYEGTCYLKTKVGTLKKHLLILIGNEIYFFRSRSDTQHKIMHCLTGTYIQDNDTISNNSDNVSASKASEHNESAKQSESGYFALKLVIPPNKSRVIFFRKEEERKQWRIRMEAAMNQTNIFDFYNLEKTLGKGQFGLVKLGVHKKTGEKVAIKQVKKKNMTHIEVFQQRREIEVLKMCQHPNIIGLIDLFENQDYYFIVLEYMAGSDLFDYLQARDFNLGENRVREISYQLALGVKYLHSYGIVHRDLKLENVMMSDTTEQSLPKLVDFGLAKMIGPKEKADEPFGTLGYVAPEILEKKPYSLQCDLWSLGCIIYALLCSSLPFDHDSQKETIRMTCEDKVTFDSPQWKNVSKECMDLITKLLIKNPENRITVDNVLVHPWFDKLSRSFDRNKGIMSPKGGSSPISGGFSNPKGMSPMGTGSTKRIDFTRVK